MGEDINEPTVDPLNPEESLLADVAEAIQIVREGLRADGFGLERLQVQDGFQKLKALKDAKELINSNDESRKRFEIAARAVFRKYKSCLNFAFLKRICDRSVGTLLQSSDHRNPHGSQRSLQDKRPESGSWVTAWERTS